MKKAILIVLTACISAVSFGQIKLGESNLTFGFGISEHVIKTNWVPSDSDFEDWNEIISRWEHRPSVDLTWRGKDGGIEAGVVRSIRFHGAKNTFQGKFFASKPIFQKEIIDFGFSFSRYWGVDSPSLGTVLWQNGYGGFLRLNHSYFSLEAGHHLFSREGLDPKGAFAFAINSWSLKFMVSLSKVKT